MRVWDLAGNVLRAEESTHRDTVTALGYTPDGTTLVSAGIDGRIVLRDPASASKQRVWMLPGGIESLAFHPSSRLLAAGCGNGMIYLFRLPGADSSPRGGRASAHRAYPKHRLSGRNSPRTPGVADASDQQEAGKCCSACFPR